VKPVAKGEKKNIEDLVEKPVRKRPRGRSRRKSVANVKKS
jgi:hypothetical protein